MWLNENGKIFLTKFLVLSLSVRGPQLKQGQKAAAMVPAAAAAAAAAEATPATMALSMRNPGLGGASSTQINFH
jgi:hypothetical protein